MVLEDFLDMTLREILDTYCVLYNLECGYIYGISECEKVDELYENYNIDEDYPEAFSVQTIVEHEVIDYLDDELVDYEKMERIMDNLGISKKN